ncbi:hypothetical protein HanXRQr2_Chr04g0148681 [Helianthus annuus]|uniref:Uncharacterized protein n=1 Tax=Helianthus annuus TaxID=4232 RepID=A0A9K3NQZ9_HELAN|nr:hypothetical protein HanXRQr2_Chr04g0148681 [Helianthus annuus]
MSTPSASSDQSRAPGKAPAATHSPPRQMETRAAYRKRLAQGGESSSRPTHALPVNSLSAQAESAVSKALRDYNRILIEQNQVLMEQNQKLLRKIDTQGGRLEAQEKQIQELTRRTTDLKAEALKGREVQGLILRDARVDHERLNSHAERIGMMDWRVHQLEEARFAPEPEPAPVPAPPEPEAEGSDEEPEEEEEEPEEVSDNDGDDDDGSDLGDGGVDD